MAHTDFDWKSLYKERKFVCFYCTKLDINLKEKNLFAEGHVTKTKKKRLL